MPQNFQHSLWAKKKNRALTSWYDFYVPLTDQKINHMVCSKTVKCYQKKKIKGKVMGSVQGTQMCVHDFKRGRPHSDI